MAVWGPAVAEELRRDVRFALTFKVGKSRRPLTDTERDMVAHAIAAASTIPVTNEKQQKFT